MAFFVEGMKYQEVADRYNIFGFYGKNFVRNIYSQETRRSGWGVKDFLLIFTVYCR